MDDGTLPEDAFVAGTGPARQAVETQATVNEDTAARLGEQFDADFREVDEEMPADGQDDVSVQIDGRQAYVNIRQPGEEAVQVTFFCGLNPMRSTAFAYAYAAMSRNPDLSRVLEMLDAHMEGVIHPGMILGSEDETALHRVLGDPERNQDRVYSSFLAGEPKPFGEDPIDKVRTQAMADAMLWAQSQQNVKPEEIVAAAREFTAFYQYGDQ